MKRGKKGDTVDQREITVDERREVERGSKGITVNEAD